jgi:hypothetical protein
VLIRANGYDACGSFRLLAAKVLGWMMSATMGVPVDLFCRKPRGDVAEARRVAGNQSKKWRAFQRF